MKTNPISLSKRSGLVFPVRRFKNKLKKIPQSMKRISIGAGVYLTSVLEYLVGKILF
jgi:hypothetical protein